jgi:flavodoxin
MKVAIVYFSKSNGQEKIKNLSSIIARGIQDKNRSALVDLIDGRLEIGKKLTAYKYIIVGVPTQSWFKGDFARTGGDVF